MAIKISKVARELNVGFQTLVEFLHKNNQDVENNINARLTDEQYEMLVKAFKNDQDLKQKSDMYITSRHKEKEKAKTAPQQPVEEIKTVVTPVSAPKIVGKIDLKEDGRKRFK